MTQGPFSPSSSNSPTTPTTLRAPTRRTIACAECRRLKLKCDRTVPCSTCVKRGCTQICPDGQLERGPQHESRVMLADNRRLRDKAAILQERIDGLQTAIRQIRGVSPRSSAGDSEQTPHNVDTLADVDEEETGECDVAAIVGTLGTLHLGDQPDFIGGWGASDILMMNGSKDGVSSKSRREAGKGVVVVDTIFLPWLSSSEPLETLAAQLPDRETAFRLTTAYLTHLGWMVGGLGHFDVYGDLLEVLYPIGGPISPTGSVTATDMALLFTILAMGILVDLDNKPDSALAWWYCGCARAGLAIDEVPRKPSLQAIRVTHMKSWALHFLMSDYPPARKAAYSMQGISIQMAKSIGLLRDDRGWELDEKVRQCRRGLLWDIVLFAGFVSASHNRPPALPFQQLDALFPADPFPYINSNGGVEESYTSFTHRYAKQVLLPVIHRAFGIRPVSYAMILRLDRLVRDYPVPPHLRVPQVGEPILDATYERQFQALNVHVFMMKLLVYIHRPFFARALEHRDADPLASPFRESFISAFRAASDVTATMRLLYHHAPVCRRITYLWSAAFSCSVFQCAIMIRAPNCVLVPAAWHEFNLTLQMLEELGSGMECISQMLPPLRRLRDKAIASMADASHIGAANQHPENELDDAEEAFIFGRPRVVTCTREKCTCGGKHAKPIPQPDSEFEPLDRNQQDNVTLSGGSFNTPSPASSQETRVPPLHPFQLDYGSVESLDAWNQLLKQAEMLGPHSTVALDGSWNDLLLDLNDNVAMAL